MFSGSTRHPQSAPVIFHRPAATTNLHAKTLGVEGGLYGANIFPVGIELFGRNHREGGHEPLTKLRVGNANLDSSTGVDRQDGVHFKPLAGGRGGIRGKGMRCS